MHRIRATARSTRFRVERATAGRANGRTELLPPPVHLSLRDSRTLNLAIPIPTPHSDANITRAHLLISRAHRRYKVPLTSEGPLLTGTTTLRDALEDVREEEGTPRLTEGVWRLTLITTDTHGRTRRHGFAAPADTTPPPTPTVPHAPNPRTGTLIRVVRCRTGRAVLQVTRSRPRAELLRFVPRGDGITVHGRLVMAPAGRRRRARAVRRRDGVTVPVGALWEGADFSFRLPLAEMAAAGPGQWVWDFHIEEETAAGGGAPLPLGRWLRDVRDPAACPTPFRVFALPGGALIRAHAHFTKSGAFAVTCWDITHAETSAEASAEASAESIAETRDLTRETTS
ncbi:hypothetical protein ACIBKX_06785 [Streptomyces sp. NPDC050658]|uniref:hypothetical protein n=1 Tax=unclassified Streptomyces TaxID=2593676 RepID=UPI00342A9021